MRTALIAFALALGSAAVAQEEPTLEALATDGVRMCMSIAQDRAPADAAAIFGFTAGEALFQRETARGKVEVLPPDATRRSCRVQVSALTLDPKTVLDAVAEFITKPPQNLAPLQMRIAERLGNYAARVSIWASSDGRDLGMVTLYEILANEYYLGPKVMIDYLIDRK
ncbi:MAG: hypothetical protein QM698_16540 [Micropepsaceae bacterium]